MDTNDDTDTLIAVVSSLLTSLSPPIHEILDALTRYNGDPVAAAHAFNSNSNPKLDGPASTASLTPQKQKKRKRAGLDAWLKPARQQSLQRHSSVSHTRTKPLSPIPSSSATATTIPTTNLLSILRQPPSPTKTKSATRLAPLTLATPALVAAHTPCTLHQSVLPPELACRLFYAMLDLSRAWQRNTWWLFDRVVESPHRTSFFARRDDGIDGDETWQEAAQFWYNGRKTDQPALFPPEMEEACRHIEPIVNEEMKKRKRYPLEWGVGNDIVWRANVAASNCYEGAKESVGFHSDQLTYLGPYPTIASLSLGTTRNFSLREVIPADEVDVRKARTFNIPLSHNSLTIMHASCQEKFKHSIPPQRAIDLFRPAFPRVHKESDSETQIEPSTCRINITFRFYRPDFRPPSIPRCRCGVPTILRPDMKGRSATLREGDKDHDKITNDKEVDRYWWTCYAGAQNGGKGCDFWRVMDMRAEGRRAGCILENEHIII